MDFGWCDFITFAHQILMGSSEFQGEKSGTLPYPKDVKHPHKQRLTNNKQSLNKKKITFKEKEWLIIQGTFLHDWK